MQRSAQHGRAYGTGLALPPDLVLLSALWGVVLDIGAVLDSASPDVAKVSAIRSYMRDQLPAARPQVRRGDTAQDVAAMIGSRLMSGMLATDLFTALTGQPVHVAVREQEGRPATDDERAELRWPAGTELYERSGLLMAGSIICARVTLRIVSDPAWLPAGALGKIRSGQPCGGVLAPYGLHRPFREVKVSAGTGPADPGPGVLARAVLALNTSRIGIATEDVGDDICYRLAAYGR